MGIFLIAAVVMAVAWFCSRRAKVGVAMVALFVSIFGCSNEAALGSGDDKDSIIVAEAVETSKQTKNKKTNSREIEVVTITVDTTDVAYRIGDGKVGYACVGKPVTDLNEIYGQQNVKQLQISDMEAAMQSSDSTIVEQNYYVYDDNNKLLFVALTQAEVGQDKPIIKRIVIKDDRYRTKRGISINSTVGDIIDAYPDVNVFQSKDNRLFLYVSSVDSYIRIDTTAVRGFDSNFRSTILLDSLNRDAELLAFTMSYETHDNSILSSQFWNNILQKVISWVILKLPSLLFIVLIFVVLLRLLKYTISRIEALAKKRAENDNNRDTAETVKRITTLAGIIRGAGTILLWILFLLMFLSKINIDIAPILASAGILGLAVGFGAQELVRDFISGFFMLLEDQLRTGDMAIINDTQGVVEKLELRTVTLRDAAGVVHIFQNGKINTLSNMTKEWSAIVLEIGVAYKEDIDRVMNIMQEVGDKMVEDEVFGKNMLGTVTILGLDSFADSAIVIKAVIKSRPMEQWALKREYNRRLKIVFDKENIEMPFPHISLYAGDATKPLPIQVEHPSSNKS